MTNLERLLSQYAAYHLDRKNVVTHFIGIPLIVFSIICLLARPGMMIAGMDLTFAMAVLAVAVIYYLCLDLLFGALMAVIFILIYPLAHEISAWGIIDWFSTSIAIFIVGWLFQFIGHFYERKKPAFTDDLIGLAIGPLFVLAEFVFLLGFRKSLQQKIDQEARKQRAQMDQKTFLVQSDSNLSTESSK